MAVEFAGEGEGLEEMSWGMWEIWQAMGRQRNQLPIGGRVAVEPGTTLDDLAAELRYMMERFPSMRTRLRFAPGGRALQQLFSTGRATLEVYDAAPDTDPQEVAAAVEERYRSEPFDFAGQWPVRMAAVRRHGRPVQQVTVMHHLVTDGLGGAIMLDQLRARDTTPVSGCSSWSRRAGSGPPRGSGRTSGRCGTSRASCGRCPRSSCPAPPTRASHGTGPRSSTRRR
ncbi:condensation domain-containing protein [Streptomyces sp. Tue 6430]|nr:condensation domain-containing protein [Streptomyces sp. Tue 6430]